MRYNHRTKKKQSRTLKQRTRRLDKIKRRAFEDSLLHDQDPRERI